MGVRHHASKLYQQSHGRNPKEGGEGGRIIVVVAIIYAVDER